MQQIWQRSSAHMSKTPTGLLFLLFPFSPPFHFPLRLCNIISHFDFLGPTATTPV